MKRLHLLVALAVAFAACDKIPQTKRIQATQEIEMDVLFVRLPQTRAVALIPQLRDPRSAADATKAVLKLIEAGEATLIAWPFLATKSGQRAVSEQSDEFRYAREWHPPGSAKVTETPAQPAGAPETPPAPVDPAAQPPEPATIKTTETSHEPAPAAFETRNLGVIFEVEPTIAPNGRTIDLNLVPMHTRLRGMRKSTIEGPSPGSKVVVELPEFVSHKVTTSISVEDGDYTLLGVFNVIDMPGQTELFILHTRIKRIEVPSSEPPPPATPAGGPPGMRTGAGYPDATRGGE